MADKVKWYKHKDHGYLARQGDYVVSPLLLNTAQEQEDEELWKKLKLRLKVNAGCGAVSSEEFSGELNPDYKPVKIAGVPCFIQQEFLKYFE